MEVSKSKDIGIGYFLNERKLIELESILKEVSNEIQYIASCKDGTSIYFSDLNELINYPNRKEKQYSHITISNDPKSSIRVSLLFSSRDFAPISYRISGDERNVDYYSRKIEDFIMSLKKWYSFFAVSTLWIYIFITLFLCVPIMFFLYTTPLTQVETASIAFLVCFSAHYLFIKFKEYIFPVASFELGDGIDRARFRSQVRALIFGGILLSAVIGYLVNQIPNLSGP